MCDCFEVLIYTDNVKNQEARDVWDVIIVGGGPAGMMAGVRAAFGGARVLLLEKNDTLGKKLLITGGGRCNVTNNEPDVRKLLPHYTDAEPFLYAPFSEFSVTETVSFFNMHGVATKVEDRGRVFPVSNSARSIWDVLVNQLRELGVTVISNAHVTGINHTDALYTISSKKGSYAATQCILATGGISHPETGSTGDGFTFLQQLGHTVRTPSPTLVPLVVSDAWIHSMAGVTIPNCALTLEKTSGTDKDTRITTRGSVLCTHVGISGPPVINISTDVSDVLPYADVVLRLNLFPEYSVEKISAMILEHIESMPSSYLFNVLRKIMHAHLADHILTTFSLTRDMQSLTLPKAKRFEIARYLKSIPIHVERLLGSDKAIVTRGGVPLSEIHTKTCESTLHTGLFIVGDLLDINRPSGGYSLQLCWTTGHVAGVAAAKRL